MDATPSPPDQLAILKLVTAGLDAAGIRYMILRDARHIVAAQPGLDWAYVERWADEVNVREFLREARP